MSGSVQLSPEKVYRRAFVIGSGFFTVALIEPMYSAYVPLMLYDHLESSGAVGVVLSLLNTIAPVVIPFFAALSDRTSTRIGKRMPYIVLFLPLAALALALVPIGARVGLAALVLALALMNFFRHAARGPVVSLMPDLVPSSLRSQANGVINTMGGLAAITATVLLAPLITAKPVVPVFGPIPRALPFWIVAVLIICATAFLYRKVKEPAATRSRRENDGSELGLQDPNPPPEPRPQIGEALAQVYRSGRHGALPILAAVALWFLGWKLITPFITIYARDYLGAGEAAAGLSFGMLAVSQTVCAVPAGLLGARVGRRRVMGWALLVLIAFGVGAGVNHAAVATVGKGGLVPFWGLLVCLGAAWAVLITNCLPLLWEFGGAGAVGLYTGLYYFASQAALVLGPSLGGSLIQLSGFGALFVSFGCVVFLAASLLRIAAAEG